MTKNNIIVAKIFQEAVNFITGVYYIVLILHCMYVLYVHFFLFISITLFNKNDTKKKIHKRKPVKIICMKSFQATHCLP